MFEIIPSHKLPFTTYYDMLNMSFLNEIAPKNDTYLITSTLHEYVITYMEGIMHNIVILTNKTEYPYHTEVASMINNFLSTDYSGITTLDINDYKYDQECLSKIKELQPDVIVTLDLAGFRFRTQSGENALNMLTSKNLNLVWGDKPEYAEYLNKKISLSMIFYDATGVDHKLMEKYPNMLYYKAKWALTKDMKSFQEIWDDFACEVFLY